MLEIYDDARLEAAGQYDLSDALEQGSIVHFPKSPLPIPSEEDLIFFREELPNLLKLKNISYHPEAGRVRGLDEADAIRRSFRRLAGAVSTDMGVSDHTCEVEWLCGGSLPARFGPANDSA